MLLSVLDRMENINLLITLHYIIKQIKYVNPHLKCNSIRYEKGVRKYIYSYIIHRMHLSNRRGYGACTVQLVSTYTINKYFFYFAQGGGGDNLE
jgi:hypothetical protein